jgi:methylenetetrahydrofolate dehydrogenase (NADP+)/methenyltetrahydrofolate cyclohydrolase
MTIILDGKALSKKIQENIALKIEELKNKYNKVPGLAVILVGEDPASKVYVSRKEKMATKAGMLSKQYKMPDTIQESELIDLVESLNKDDSIHGILVLLPLPKHIDTNKIIMTVLPEKDVDGFHPVNMGKLLSGIDPYAIPCTPLGIMSLLKEYNIDLKGKETVVIGRSNIVGKPISILLLAEHSTVTICHSRTKNIPEICKRADVIIVAIGKEKFLKADWVKPGAVIIDVGTNKNPDTGILCGDVDFDNVKEIASHITPSPGGVGPMTIATLLSNTLSLFEKKLS